MDPREEAALNAANAVRVALLALFKACEGDEITIGEYQAVAFDGARADYQGGE